MSVEYIDHMGDDLRVANAARVSFDKETEWEREWAEEDDSLFKQVLKKSLSSRDAKLLNYLAKHGHWTPFSHCTITLRVTAPIAVARQLFKHKVGGTENEISRRYVDTEPSFYFPDVWRGRAENAKQGSGEPVEGQAGCGGITQGAAEYSLAAYTYLIESGVCPEQARLILPQNMMTSWYWTGSLSFFARVCQLRLDAHAQKETQEVAQMISDIITPLYPVSWRALIGN